MRGMEKGDDGGKERECVIMESDECRELEKLAMKFKVCESGGQSENWGFSYKQEQCLSSTSPAGTHFFLQPLLSGGVLDGLAEAQHPVSSASSRPSTQTLVPARNPLTVAPPNPGHPVV